MSNSQTFHQTHGLKNRNKLKIRIKTKKGAEQKKS